MNMSDRLLFEGVVGWITRMCEWIIYKSNYSVQLFKKIRA